MKQQCPKCGKEVSVTASGELRKHKCIEKEEVKEVEPKAETSLIDRVIEKFISDRDEIAEIKKRHQAELAEIEAMQQKRTDFLREQMNRLGVKSLKTTHGTCFTDVKSSATVADREEFFKWVRTNERFEFLESRVSKTAVKQMLEDGELLPPGVNYTEVKDIKVRRS